MIKRMLIIAILALGFASSTNAATDIVEQALSAVAAPSAEEMRSRLFDTSVAVYEEEHRRQAIATLPSSLRDRRITEGKLLRRIERVAQPVLELHQQAKVVELFLYRDGVLNLLKAELRGGCVLLLSDSLAKALYDEELTGVIAHELGHAYFMHETLAARTAGDDEALRVIELKCDAVAMLTLRLLGRDPAGHLRGLWKIINLRNDAYIWNASFETLLRKSGGRTHPNIVERGQFKKRFIRWPRHFQLGDLRPAGEHHRRFSSHGSRLIHRRGGRSALRCRVLLLPREKLIRLRIYPGQHIRRSLPAE